MKYFLGEGSVQSILVCDDGSYFHFGRAEYSKEIPILSKSIKEQAEPIVKALNNEIISLEKAKELLSKIYF